MTKVTQATSVERLLANTTPTGPDAELRKQGQCLVSLSASSTLPNRNPPHGLKY